MQTESDLVSGNYYSKQLRLRLTTMDAPSRHFLLGTKSEFFDGSGTISYLYTRDFYSAHKSEVAETSLFTGAYPKQNRWSAIYTGVRDGVIVKAQRKKGNWETSMPTSRVSPS